MVYQDLGCEKQKKTKQANTKIFFCPSRPPFKNLCVCDFLHFKEKTQPEHKEFRGLKAPKKGGFRHGILGEIFVFGCFSALKIASFEDPQNLPF